MNPLASTSAFLGSLLLLNVIFFGQANSEESRTVDQIADVPTVELLNVRDGSTLSIAENPTEKLTVLCFLGSECPLAKLYAGRLQEFANQFEEARFIGINSNVQDSLDDIKQYIAESGIKFEFAKDYDNLFADQLNVTRTPEVIVFDQSRKILYRGRVDDQYLPGVSRTSANRHDLKIAIESALSNKAIEIKETEPTGCLLGRKRESVADATVTFANQVSRVLQKHCVECHRDGEIGPFSLETYDEAIGWADMMLEVIEEKRMPPWHADASVGSFSNSRHMSEEDKLILQQWVDQGTPMGDVSQLPKPLKKVAGWRLPKAPDQVIAMSRRPYQIPADETVEYQYFVVDPQLKEDRWVSAAEVIPGNRSVVHHCIVFIRPPDGQRTQGVGWLAGYVPGQTPLAFEPDRARFVPKGSKLVFQMHYTPNGSPQSDLTKIGLVFAEESEIKNELITVMAIDQGFEIQPYDESHKVEISRGRLPSNAKLLSVSPHMHYRGKSFESSIVSQDDVATELIRVPQYDFNWQHRYEFESPIPLDSVKMIKGTVEFDNSEGNPFNPNPAELVWWGDQTWEEMAVAFYDVVIPRKPASSESEQAKEDSKSRSTAELNEAQLEKATRIANEFFERFDSDDNKVVTRKELPRAIRTWGFNRYDKDGDGELTRDEVLQQAKYRVN